MKLFSSPATNKDLVSCLNKMNKRTFFLGGGTDLSIQLKNMKRHEFSLIDLTNIKENKEIRLNTTTVEIGSAVTISELLLSKIIKFKLPALWEACNTLGSTQIRNRATLGGNISNASQSADTLPVLLALGVFCIVLNKQGTTQKELILDFLHNLKRKPLLRATVLTKIIIPLTNTYSSFSKIGDKQSVTIAKINCCICFDKNHLKQILKPIIYLGAIGPLPIRGNLIEKNIKQTRHLQAPSS